MAKKVYTVDFTVTLSTCRAIQADSEEEALRVARRLLDSDTYGLDLIESWDEPYSGWHEPNDPVVLGEEELPEMFVEDYVEWLGFNPWED